MTTDVVQMMRCTNVCVAVGAANAGGYTITNADLGSILRVQETASNSGGATVLWTATYVGPVTSAAAGFALVGHRQAAVLNANGVALATAQVNVMSAAADAHIAAFAGRTVKLHRAPGVKGPLHAWACPASVPDSGPPPPCTAAVKIRRNGTLRLPAGMTGKVRVVVVRGKRPH